LEGLELLHPCSSAMTATVTPVGENTLGDGIVKVDITLSDAANAEQVALIFRGLSLRVLSDNLPVQQPVKAELPALSAHEAASLYQPYWIEKAVLEADAPLEQVLLVGNAQDVERFANLLAQSDNAPQIQRIEFAAELDASSQRRMNHKVSSRPCRQH